MLKTPKQRQEDKKMAWLVAVLCLLATVIWGIINLIKHNP